MPATHSIDEDRRVVILTVSGEVDESDWLRGVKGVRDDARFDRSFALLIDVRGQIGGGISSDGIRTLAKVPSLVAPDSPKAVLLSTDFGYGMTRMFNLTVGEEAHAVQIFRDEAEARRYVGLESD